MAWIGHQLNSDRGSRAKRIIPVLPGSLEAMRARAGKHAVPCGGDSTVLQKFRPVARPERDTSTQAPTALPVAGAAQPLAWLKRPFPVDWRHPAWHLPKCWCPRHHVDGSGGTGPTGLEDHCRCRKPFVCSRTTTQPGAAPFAGWRTGMDSSSRGPARVKRVRSTTCIQWPSPCA